MLKANSKMTEQAGKAPAFSKEGGVLYGLRVTRRLTLFEPD